MTTDNLIRAVESGKYEGATFVVGEEYILESTFLAKLFIRVWFNVVSDLEEYLYLHALMFPIEFLDLAFVVGEEYILESTFLAKLFIRVWFNVVSDLEEYLYLHALMFPIEFLDLAGLCVVFRTRGRCTLDRKDGRQIVRRLSGGNLRHYCIQELALCDGGSKVVWVGIHKGGKMWLRIETPTPSCSWTFWKTSACHTKEELIVNNIRLQDDYVCQYMAAAVK